MTTVMRVSSGDTIQVRTGVLMGIGPVGPTGPTGPEGKEGPPGDTGPIGATGAVGEQVTSLVLLGTQSVPNASNLLVNFSVVKDQYSALKSVTNIVPGLGNWYVTAYVKFAKQASINATGSRVVRLIGNNKVWAAQAVAAAPGIETELTIAGGLLIETADASTIYQLQVYQTEGVALSLLDARLWLCRTGPGPQGVQGIQGVQGPTGPAGPRGQQGVPGTVGNNNTTFAQLEAGTAL